METISMCFFYELLIKCVHYTYLFFIFIFYQQGLFSILFYCNKLW